MGSSAAEGAIGAGAGSRIGVAWTGALALANVGCVAGASTVAVRCTGDLGLDASGSFCAVGGADLATASAGLGDLLEPAKYFCTDSPIPLAHASTGSRK